MFFTILMNYFIFLFFFSFIFADNWAVIVSGSYSYSNYRHQADACHNYNILIENGFNPDHIILFLYDDVAWDEENPLKGHLYNRVGDDAPDVYANCKPDYTGRQITPLNYLNVLLGNEEDVRKETGIEHPKVLKTNSSDNIFLTFFDHGSIDVIGFPDDHLFKDELLNTFIILNRRHKYNKIVYYLESCQSGSMFEDYLPDNMNIYALTATHPYQPSWGYYCEGKTHGEYMPCLGDLFAITWMESLELKHPNETLQTHFELIKKNVTKSEPSQYGDKSFLNDLIWDFAGKGKKSDYVPNHENQTPVSGYDASIKYYENKMKMAKSEIGKRLTKARYEQEKRVKDITEKRFMYVAEQLSNDKSVYSRKKIENFKCYRDVANAYRDICGYVEAGFEYYHILGNLCDKTNGSTNEIIKSLKDSCGLYKI